MKFLDIYRSKLGLNTEDEVFNYFLSTTKDTIKSWDYFVDWPKIKANIKDIEICLNLMNYLIGKDNIKDEAVYLFNEHPKLISVIPSLVAIRTSTISVLDAESEGMFENRLFNFRKKKNYSLVELNEAIEFLDKSGFLELLSSKRIKNVVDYVLGVEVGLDTNARKNRSGKAMENLTEIFVKRICQSNNYRYLSEATAAAIKKTWGIDVVTDKARRRFDFAINANGRLFLIEVNYYSGGGSKLKSVAGEFNTLYDLMKTKDNNSFIWVTEGKGWYTAKAPLRETFNHTDYVLNLNMLENGVLDYLIKEECKEMANGIR